MNVGRSRIENLVSFFVKVVHPQEAYAVFYSASSFFFILTAYFVVIPLRDEGAISLGLENLPELFVGSLFLTLVAAPLSTLVFSLPNLSRAKALVLIHRFFSVSLAIFFILWVSSSPEYSLSSFKWGLISMPSTIAEERNVEINKSTLAHSSDWGGHGWFYISVRIGLFLWVALLNLITISSTWARVIDVMDSESGSRLFGFIGAGATLGQLFGSLFATGMAWMGPYLLLFASLLMEFAAQSSKRISMDTSSPLEGSSRIRQADPDQFHEANEQTASTTKRVSVNFLTSVTKPQHWAMLDGLRLILSSAYLLYISLFLWLSAAVSSFFYFQKVNVIATTITSPTGRRRLFAQINSFIAVFILAGQLALTGRILAFAGVTMALCSSPVMGFLNLIAIAVWPSWLSIAVSETLRKVVNYVVTRPGRELLFTVVSQDEKYKAKVCIDVVVQRLGDATAAGVYKLLYSSLNGKTTTVSLYFLPVCLLWIATAFHLGRRQIQLAKFQTISST